MTTVKFTNPLHCTSCYWKGETCVASSSTIDDPLRDPEKRKMLPPAVRCQVDMLCPPVTPATSTKVVSPNISRNRLRRRSNSITLVQERAKMPPTHPAPQEPPAWRYFTSDPRTPLPVAESAQIHKGWRKSTWKGKARATELGPGPQEWSGSSHWVSERIEDLEARRKVMGVARKALSPVRKEKNEVNAAMVRTGIGMVYVL